MKRVPADRGVWRALTLVQALDLALQRAGTHCLIAIDPGQRRTGIARVSRLDGWTAATIETQQALALVGAGLAHDAGSGYVASYLIERPSGQGQTAYRGVIQTCVLAGRFQQIILSGGARVALVHREAVRRKLLGPPQRGVRNGDSLIRQRLMRMALDDETRTSIHRAGGDGRAALAVLVAWGLGAKEFNGGLNG